MVCGADATCAPWPLGCVCARAEGCAGGSSPVYPLVVVVSIKKLHLLKGPGAGQAADDGRVHQEKQVQGRCSWPGKGVMKGERNIISAGFLPQKKYSVL